MVSTRGMRKRAGSGSPSPAPSDPNKIGRKPRSPSAGPSSSRQAPKKKAGPKKEAGRPKNSAGTKKIATRQKAAPKKKGCKPKKEAADETTSEDELNEDLVAEDEDEDEEEQVEASSSKTKNKGKGRATSQQKESPEQGAAQQTPPRRKRGRTVTKAEEELDHEQDVKRAKQAPARDQKGRFIKGAKRTPAPRAPPINIPADAFPYDIGDSGSVNSDDMDLSDGSSPTEPAWPTEPARFVPGERPVTAKGSRALFKQMQPTVRDFVTPPRRLRSLFQVQGTKAADTVPRQPLPLPRDVAPAQVGPESAGQKTERKRSEKGKSISPIMHTIEGKGTAGSPISISSGSPKYPSSSESDEDEARSPPTKPRPTVRPVLRPQDVRTSPDYAPSSSRSAHQDNNATQPNPDPRPTAPWPADQNPYRHSTSTTSSFKFSNSATRFAPPSIEDNIPTRDPNLYLENYNRRDGLRYDRNFDPRRQPSWPWNSVSPPRYTLDMNANGEEVLTRLWEGPRMRQTQTAADLDLTRYTIDKSHARDYAVPGEGSEAADPAERWQEMLQELCSVYARKMSTRLQAEVEDEQHRADEEREAEQQEEELVQAHGLPMPAFPALPPWVRRPKRERRRRWGSMTASKSRSPEPRGTLVEDRLADTEPERVNILRRWGIPVEYFRRWAWEASEGTGRFRPGSPPDEYTRALMEEWRRDAARNVGRRVGGLPGAFAWPGNHLGAQSVERQREEERRRLQEAFGMEWEVSPGTDTLLEQEENEGEPERRERGQAYERFRKWQTEVGGGDNEDADDGNRTDETEIKEEEEDEDENGKDRNNRKGGPGHRKGDDKDKESDDDDNDAPGAGGAIQEPRPEKEPEDKFQDAQEGRQEKPEERGQGKQKSRQDEPLQPRADAAEEVVPNRPNVSDDPYALTPQAARELEEQIRREPHKLPMHDWYNVRYVDNVGWRWDSGKTTAQEALPLPVERYLPGVTEEKFPAGVEEDENGQKRYFAKIRVIEEVEDEWGKIEERREAGENVRQWPWLGDIMTKYDEQGRPTWEPILLGNYAGPLIALSRQRWIEEKTDPVDYEKLEGLEKKVLEAVGGGRPGEKMLDEIKTWKEKGWSFLDLVHKHREKRWSRLEAENERVELEKRMEEQERAAAEEESRGRPRWRKGSEPVGDESPGTAPSKENAKDAVPETSPKE